MLQGRPSALYAIGLVLFTGGCGGGYTGVNKTITFYGPSEQIVWTAFQDGPTDDWIVVNSEVADSDTPTGMVPYRFQIHSEDERYGLAYVTKQTVTENEKPHDRFVLHLRFLTGDDSTRIFHVTEKPNPIEAQLQLQMDQNDASVYSDSSTIPIKRDSEKQTIAMQVSPATKEIAAIEFKDAKPHRFFVKRDIDVTRGSTIDIDLKGESVEMKSYKFEFDNNTKNVEGNVALKLKSGTTVNIYDKTSKEFFVPVSGLIEGDLLQLSFSSRTIDSKTKQVSTEKSMVEYYAVSNITDIHRQQEDVATLQTIRARTDGNNYGRFVIGGLNLVSNNKNPPLTGFSIKLFQQTNTNFSAHIVVTKNYLKSTSDIRTPDFRLTPKYNTKWEFSDSESIIVDASAILSSSPKLLDELGYSQDDLVDGVKIYKSSQRTQMITPMNLSYALSAPRAAN